MKRTIITIGVTVWVLYTLGFALFVLAARAPAHCPPDMTDPIATQCAR